MVDRIAGQAVPPWPRRGPSPVAGPRAETKAVAGQDMEARRMLERLFNSSAPQAVTPSRPADELTSHLGRFLDVIA
ncbi:MAG TPA: hypothetical protein VM118_06690 [Acidobacteriota bacterium]|nr:hypothetical protein [Acidobacteriota bacterium]